MQKTELIDLLEEHLGVDPSDPNPFAPKVSCVFGSQKDAPKAAGLLAMCERGALIFHPRGTSRFGATLSGKKLDLIMLWRKVTDYYMCKDGKMHLQPAFSDCWIALFKCSPELVEAIRCDLGARGIDHLYIEKYQVVETIVDRHRRANNKIPYKSTKSKSKAKKKEGDDAGKPE
jgi:hypothetical protein